MAALLCVVAAPLPGAGASQSKVPTTGWLLGRDFVSVKVAGDPIIEGREIELGFFRHASSPRQPKKPTLSVHAGCNWWGGKFRLRKGRLRIPGPIESTAMGCLDDPDPWLMSKFRKGLVARVNGRRLVLSRPAEGVRIVLRPAATD